MLHIKLMIASCVHFFDMSGHPIIQMTLETISKHHSSFGASKGLLSSMDMSGENCHIRNAFR
jgi:hypothetical protein